WFGPLPAGRSVGRGALGPMGLTDAPVPCEGLPESAGSTVRPDSSTPPAQQTGPINCPLPSTVSASRVAIAMLAGGGEAPNEGHFRPVEVVTRPGTMFHPRHPAPCFLYGWAGDQAIEAIYQAISSAVPESVPACSGGDICALVWWGER